MNILLKSFPERYTGSEDAPDDDYLSVSSDDDILNQYEILQFPYLYRSCKGFYCFHAII